MLNYLKQLVLLLYLRVLVHLHYPEDVTLLVECQSTNVLLFYLHFPVPIPLVYLALLQTQVLRQLFYFLFIPILVLRELIFQNLDLFQ